MHSFSNSIVINAKTRQVWDVLADIGEIYRWNPGVSHSRLEGHQCVGMGAKRICELPGRRYLDEAVVEWVPLERLTMRIVASNLPFKRADIRFDLKEDPTRSATQVTVTPHYQLKFGVMGRLLNAALVGPAYRRGMTDLLCGLKVFAEGRQAALPTSAT